jgi:undecaprenyl-diphosphatase
MINHILTLNTQIFQLINSHHTVFFDYFFLIVTQLGSGWVAVPLVGLIIALVTQKKYLARALVCAAVAGTLAGTANTQIKRAVHSQRPLVYFAAKKGSQENFTVHVVGQPLRYNSFPSGHTATAFAAATILALLFGGSFYWAFAPALLVAYSRMYVGAHFPLDLLGGMAVGIGIAALCLLLAQRLNVIPRPVPLRSFHA